MKPVGIFFVELKLFLLRGTFYSDWGMQHFFLTPFPPTGPEVETEDSYKVIIISLKISFIINISSSALLKWRRNIAVSRKVLESFLFQSLRATQERGNLLL